MKKVGINGFGRIGRMVFRAWLKSEPRPHKNPFPDYEIVAVNNPLKKGQSIEHFIHMLTYDTVHGKLGSEIEVLSDGFIIHGKKIMFFTEMDPANIPWESCGVDVVVDSTGVFKDKEGLSKHLHGTVKKVIMTAPGDNLDGTFVMGVNDHLYDKNLHHVISNASCTTNCLAPIVKVLEENFGVEKGLVSTCHAVTNDQSTLDFIHDDLRRARAAFSNIIPTKTGAAKAVALVLPSMKNKLDGFALRVPVPDVSVVDGCFVLKKEVTKEEINEAFKKASEKELFGILGYNEKELVSSDFIGDSRSSIVDSKYTQAIGNLVKVLSWYDNEWGYSCRVLDLIKKL